MQQYFTQGIDVASLVKFQILMCKTAKSKHQFTLNDTIYRTMYNTKQTHINYSPNIKYTLNT